MTICQNGIDNNLLTTYNFAISELTIQKNDLYNNLEGTLEKWSEKEFLNHRRWFHGTTAIGLKKIIKNGIVVKYNQDNSLDFGYGFYLCPEFDWALGYIKGQLEIVDDDLEIKCNDGYVLEYQFSPWEIIKGNNYKFFCGLDESFGIFVFNNRIKYKRHFVRKCIHDYDLVAGPMSDGNQIDDFNDYRLGRISKGELLDRLLLPKENWQLLLHKQYLCNNLKPIGIYNLKGERVDGIIKEKYDKN